MSKIYMHSLGCAKNTVNTEQMLALLTAAGHEIVADPEDANVAVVNTCGFIDSAKSEAIEAILSLAELKENGGKLQALIACGCLTQRYGSEFQDQLPEVDAVLGVGSYTDIVEAVDAALHKNTEDQLGFFAPKEQAELNGPRVLTSPNYWAWLRIAEGCDNRCAYCAIPDIRGPFRSRSVESIVAEAEELAQMGVKEIILVAQDTTRYGLDIYGELALADLLLQLEKIEPIRWIRIHYLYPDEISDRLLDIMAQSKRILPYFDIPIQHISDPVLKAMNRRGDSRLIRHRIGQIREKMPNAVIRTSLIVGFPGETHDDFDALYDFLQQFKLERVGIFCYSLEDGTPAAKMQNQVDEETKSKRQESLYMLQHQIMEAHGNSMIGKTLEVLCCGVDDSGRCYGRSYMDSPDIDGALYFSGGEKGQFYTVLIEQSDGCDFFGRII